MFRKLIEKFSYKLLKWRILSDKPQEVVESPDITSTTHDIEFPDGVKLTVKVKTNRSTGRSVVCTVVNGVETNCGYLGVSVYDPWLGNLTEKWEPPMKEVFMLFIKDHKNFKRYYNNVCETFVHGILNYEFSIRSFVNTRCYESNTSLTEDQLKSLQIALSLYKYTERPMKYKALKAERKKRDELTRAVREAKKINDYLETLK